MIELQSVRNQWEDHTQWKKHHQIDKGQRWQLQREEKGRKLKLHILWQLRNFTWEWPNHTAQRRNGFPQPFVPLKRLLDFLGAHYQICAKRGQHKGTRTTSPP